MAFFDDLDSLLDGASKTAVKASSLQQILAGKKEVASLNDPIPQTNMSSFTPPVLQGKGFDLSDPKNIALAVLGIIVLKKVL